MSKYSSLRSAIIEAIYENTDGSITGGALQAKLLQIVDNLDLGSLFMGVATAATVPSTEANGFYLALTGGTYSSFLTTGGTPITVGNQEIAILAPDGDAWQKSVLAHLKGNEVVDGYYDSASGKFYADQQHQSEVAGAADTLYIDLADNETYRYDTQEHAFVRVNDPSGEHRVNGTLTAGKYKKITGTVGGYASTEETGNPSWRYLELFVRKDETVFFKTVGHQGVVQPVAFVGSDQTLRYIIEPPQSGASPESGTYLAPADGTFTVNLRRNGTAPDYVWDEAYLYVNRSQSSSDDRVDHVIDVMNGMQGQHGIRYTRASMADGDDINLSEVFPHHNKFGNNIQLTCKVSTMGTLKFWFGSTDPANVSAFDYRMLAIDGTHIKLYRVTSATTLLEQVAHGVKISDYLSANLQCLADGTMKVQLNSLDSAMQVGGNDYCILGEWAYGVGRIKLESVGSTLSDVQMSVTNDMFRSPFWIVGASQEGMSDIRIGGQLLKMGYLDCLNNARSGRTSAYALQDLRRALAFGLPKYLYFAFSNDGFDPAVYEPVLQEAIALAEGKGMELIVKAVPVHQPTGQDDTVEAQRAKRDYILNCGARVFDFGKAVSADPDDPSAIYPGYLDAALIHPANAVAANAVAMQFLADVPEMMQYGGPSKKDDASKKGDTVGFGNVLAGLGFDTFSETEDYAIGDVVVHDDTLQRFTANKEAGAWDAARAAPTTLDELLAEGGIPVTASQITPKSDTPTAVTNKFRAQTTGGDADLKSGPALLLDIKGNLDDGLNPFKATAFVSTGMDLVDPEATLSISGSKAYYFPCVAGNWGAYGTTQENNGYIVIGGHVTEVYYKATKPTASDYGKACAKHTHTNGIDYYTPQGIGWLTIVCADNDVPACHLAWSNYNDGVSGTFGNAVKSIDDDVQWIHAWGMAFLSGGGRTVYDEIDLESGHRYRRTDRAALDSLGWTMQADTTGETPTYTFSCNLASMMPNGLWQANFDGLVMDGTTLTYTSGTIDSVAALQEAMSGRYVYFELATVASSATATTTGTTANDFGLTYFMDGDELAAVAAYVTECFYQSGKDQLFNAVTYQKTMAEVVAAALCDHESRLLAIEGDIKEGFNYLRVTNLDVTRKLTQPS